MEEVRRESSPEEDDLKDRSSKKVKGGDQVFTNESTQVVCYDDMFLGEKEKEVRGPRRTFKDMVLGSLGESAKEGRNKGELSQEQKEITEQHQEEEEVESVIIEEKQWGKYECPAFYLSKKEELMIQKPWKGGLIVKLLGRKIGFKALETRLKQLWVLDGIITLLDLGNEFFLVTFSSDKDRDYALGEGPWLIYDHYLIVREWRPNFQPTRETVNIVSVWIRFPELPIEYYDVSFLHCVGNRIGRTVKVDKNTMNNERGKYDRLCVEVDLSKPLLAVFEVQGVRYKVEYEGLHFLCLNCGRFGHCTEGCPEKAVVEKGSSGDNGVDGEARS